MTITKDTRLLLNVERDCIRITWNDGAESYTVKSVDEFDAFIKQKKKEAGLRRGDSAFVVLCTSSMDFPDEYTDNPDIVKLADALR